MAGVTVNTNPVQRLRAAAFDLLDAADKDGIADDMALATWVQSQHTCVLAFADAIEALDKNIAGTLENTKDLSVTELRRLQKTTEAAVVLCERLKTEREVLNLQTKQVVADFMKSVTPDVVEALKTVTVIRERRWNARQNMVGVCVALGVLLVLFGSGFVAGGGNFQSRSAGVAAQAAVERCLAAAQPDRAGGEKWCPVSVLEAGKS